MNPFSLKKKISLGEILTLLSVLVSVVSVLISWSIDRKIRVKENATRIRTEIARTENTINRIVQLHLSFYESIEPDIVDASRISIVEKNPVKARDLLWQRLHQRRNEMKAKADADWEIAHINLLSFSIHVDSLYRACADRIKTLEEKQFHLMLTDLEFTTLEFDSKSTNQTAVLTNKLRETKKFYFQNHQEHIAKAKAPLEDFLARKLSQTDKELLFPE